MTEPATEQQPDPGQAPQADPPADEKAIDSLPDWARSELTRARSDAAKYRTKVRELEPAAEKARQLEEAQKTEQQRLEERAATAERERQDALNEVMRYRVAAQHGITADDIDLLGSGSEDQMTAKAQRIAALYAQQNRTTAPNPSRPVEQLRPGATPTDQKSEEDLLYEQLFGATGK